jgi:histidinol phosphatase-like PHP family hydrolase
MTLSVNISKSDSRKKIEELVKKLQSHPAVEVVAHTKSFISATTCWTTEFLSLQQYQDGCKEVMELIQIFESY